NDGSVTAPTITSWPPVSICWTCTPSSVALGSYFAAFAMIVANPCSTSCAVLTPTSTPPASVLCRIWGETIFSTTGNPIPVASFAASAADFATASFGTGMPYASQTSLPSGAVSEVRPAAFTLSRMLLTAALSCAMNDSSVSGSDCALGAQRLDLLARIAELGQHLIGVLAEQR